MSVLSDNGYNDLASYLLCDTRFPSWLYYITNMFTSDLSVLIQKFTAIPERWDGYVLGTTNGENGYVPQMNSFNSVAFGAVGEWIYRNIGGINPDEKNPGFKEVVIRPRPGTEVVYADTLYNSIRGNIATHWDWVTNENDQHFRLEMSIPPNTRADVYLNATNALQISENSTPLTSAPGILYSCCTNGIGFLYIGSGSYSFDVVYPQ